MEYAIGEMLGKGNFATVYDAQNQKTGKWFAVKTVDKKTVLQSKRNIVILFDNNCLECLI